MVERGRFVFLSVSLAVTLLLFGGSLLANTVGSEAEEGSDSLYKYLSIFSEVLGLVQTAYVDPTETEELLAGAFEGTSDALDPFSLYVPPDLAESWEETRDLSIARSGLVLLKERGVVYVAAVLPGSPAESAGIEPSAIVAEVDGVRTRNRPLSRVLESFAAEPGTVLHLEVLHFADKKTVDLELASYPRPGVVMEAQRGVPVLTPGGFHEETLANFTTSLEALGELPEVEGEGRLLIDLRGVTGGDEKVAYAVAALFSTGEIGVLKSRENVLETFNGSLKPLWTGDLVVLTDRGTQGPAEILASVLRQSANAKLVGGRTFGHSGRQTLLPLSNGGRLQVTDAFYTGPDLEVIDQGLSPDLRVRPLFGEAEEGEDADPVLERGLAVLLGEETLEPEAEAA